MTTVITSDEISESGGVECANCGEVTTESWVIGNGDEVCDECRGNYVTCERCSDLVSIDDTCSVNNGNDIVCDDCYGSHYSSCSQCSESYDCDNMTGTVTGETICNRCRSYYYSQCESCYDYYHDDNGHCPDCGDRDESAGGLIHSYGYQPDPEFHGTGPVFMGFELEFSTGWESLSQCAEIANDTAGHLAYLKEDSSIDCGFEFVTHPMSHAFAAESFPWEMLAELERAGADGYPNGLHVHVSRTAFKDCGHTYRWMKLLHRNKNDVQVIARRDSGEWAAWSNADRRNVKAYAKGERGYHRYSAINVQNSATFELRIFRGTTSATELRAALDLVDASVEYTRGLSAADIHHRDGWSWSAFIEWCAAQDGKYAALVEMARVPVAA
jgi:hypothetical protein